MKKVLSFLFIFIITACSEHHKFNGETINVVEKVLAQEIGEKNAGLFRFQLIEGVDSADYDYYKATVKNGKIFIEGTTPVALCRGAYNSLRNIGDAMVSWSGNYI